MSLHLLEWDMKTMQADAPMKLKGTSEMFGGHEIIANFFALLFSKKWVYVKDKFKKVDCFI